ncbi:MAG: cyclic peptide export ABC transporter [Cyanobacteria bacterium P01_C01_bin.70]
MNLIIFLLKYSWQAATLALLTGLISGGSSAAMIAVISRTVAEETPSRVIVLAFVALGVLALTTAMLSRILLVRFSQRAVLGLQLQLSRQILATELKPLETLGLPRLLVILTEDIQAIATAAGAVPVLIMNVASVIGCMVYISWLSWQVLGLVLLITLVASVSCRWFLVQGRRGLAAARDQQDQLFQHFRSLIEGIKELKLHAGGRQDFFAADLERTAVQVKRYNSRGLSMFAVLDSWGKFIYFFAIGLILFALPNWVGINTETRIAYVLTFTFLLGPLENLVGKLPFLSKASVALTKIKTLGFSLSAPKAVTASPVTVDWHSLTLKSVTHTYRTDSGDSEFTFGPMDLTIHPGELVFIIGGNGSGKSTLAKLLTGLYQPQQGSIWLDHQPIDGTNQEWYRQHFSVVFSDFYLFERILGFDSNVDNERAKLYLEKLQLNHKVNLDDGRFSTIALSQGQRKRLTLLSAYLENRPIYLFDEWASDQDPTFKHLFYTQFLSDLKAQGKAVFVISHDDHYFHLADRLIKLNYGQVEDDQLMTEYPSPS